MRFVLSFPLAHGSRKVLTLIRYDEFDTILLSSQMSYDSQNQSEGQGYEVDLAAEIDEYKEECGPTPSLGGLSFRGDDVKGGAEVDEGAVNSALILAGAPMSQVVTVMGRSEEEER